MPMNVNHTHTPSYKPTKYKPMTRPLRERISKILKQALRTSAKNMLKEGSWCERYIKDLKENPKPLSPSPLIYEQTGGCIDGSNRTANDWSQVGPVNACAAKVKAIKCSHIPANYTGTPTGLLSNPLVHTDSFYIKI